MRNRLADFPRIMSQVHLTSAEVNSRPSCQCTPSRSWKVSSLPSPLHAHWVARSGTIELRLFCGTCCSNSTRLLNTGIIGAMTEIVTSSKTDMLAGLSRCAICRTPAGRCAAAGAATSASTRLTIAAPIAQHRSPDDSRRLRLAAREIARRVPAVARTRGMACAPIVTPGPQAVVSAGLRASAVLLVQPSVFEAPAVVIAVHHHRVPLEIGLPAGGRYRIQDRGPRPVFRQLLFDFPDQTLALVVVGFHRLLVDQIVHFLAAIAGIVALGAADEVLVELLVGVVEPVFADGEPDR